MTNNRGGIGQKSTQSIDGLHKSHGDNSDIYSKIDTKALANVAKVFSNLTKYANMLGLSTKKYNDKIEELAKKIANIDEENNKRKKKYDDELKEMINTFGEASDEVSNFKKQMEQSNKLADKKASTEKHNLKKELKNIKVSENIENLKKSIKKTTEDNSMKTLGKFSNNKNFASANNAYFKDLEELKSNALDMFGEGYKNNKDYKDALFKLEKEHGVLLAEAIKKDKEENKNARKKDFEENHKLLKNVKDSFKNIKDGFVKYLDKHQDNFLGMLGPFAMAFEPMKELFGVFKGVFGGLKKIFGGIFSKVFGKFKKKKNPSASDVAKSGPWGTGALYVANAIKKKKGGDGNEKDGGGILSTVGKLAPSLLGGAHAFSFFKKATSIFSKSSSSLGKSASIVTNAGKGLSKGASAVTKASKGLQKTSNLFPKAFKGLNKGINQLKNGAKGIKAGAQGIKTSVKAVKSVKNIKDVANIGKGIKSGASAMKAGAKGVAKGAGRFLGPAMSVFEIGMDAYSGVKKADEWGTSKTSAGIGGALAGGEGGLGNMASNALKWGAVGSVFGPVGTAVGALAGGIVGAIGGDKIAQGLDAMGETIKQGWENTKETASKAWNNVKDNVSKAWNKTKEIASNAWNNVKDNASKAWNKTKDVASNVWNKAKEIGGGLFSKIKDNVSNTFNKVKEVTSKAWNTVTSGTKKAEDVVEKSKENAESFGDKIIRFSGHGGPIFKGLTTLAVHAFDKITNSSDKIIEDSENKAIEGITDVSKNVLDKTNLITEKALNNVSNTFDNVNTNLNNINGSINNLDGVLTDNTDIMMNAEKEKKGFLSNVYSIFGDGIISKTVGIFSNIFGDNKEETPSEVTEVGDAIIKTDGSVIKTNPQDTLVALKDVPQSMDKVTNEINQNVDNSLNSLETNNDIINKLNSIYDVLSKILAKNISINLPSQTRYDMDMLMNGGII